MTTAEEVFEYVRKKYNSEPEFLWTRFPDCAVFRHTDNRKWYGMVNRITKEKLGLAGKECVDTLTVKLDDCLLADFLTGQEGYCRAWHFGGGDWISVLLDGTVATEDIFGLIDKSFLVTAPSYKKIKYRPAKEWIVPANPKYYDIEGAFDACDVIDWKQGKGIRTGDTVFMYVASPVSAVLYRCTVTETDIPYLYSDEKLTITGLMKIKLDRRYSPDEFTFERLKNEYGISAVRGPRGVPHSLSADLNK